MHDSAVGSLRAPGFLELVGALAEPDGRAVAAARLAEFFGGSDLLLFAADPELRVPLPAPGLTQVLPRAGEWHQFLSACIRNGTHKGAVPVADGSHMPAVGCALPDGTAALLLGDDPAPDFCQTLLPVLPLLGALLRAERQLDADRARLRAADESAERARMLAGALGQLRIRLQAALDEAQTARSVARRRADDAEHLAHELELQTEELQQQAAHLETLNEELSRRTAEAEQSRAAADLANRAKSEFLANMSHELRTPINAVIGYAQLLAMGISGELTSLQTAQLERILSSSAHLLTLVNDVLDVAKIEAGEMEVEREREPVSPVVLESLALVEMEAAANDLTIHNLCRDAEQHYWGDRDRVRQILVNLMSNAVKFTEAGGHITLTSRVCDEAPSAAHVVGTGPWICIEVKDTGIGMTAEEAERVFRPFIQAEGGHTRRHGGTGLGLTISRQLSRLMGGDLTLETERGVGSIFTVWLPVAGARKGELDPSIRVGANARRASDEVRA